MNSHSQSRKNITIRIQNAILTCITHYHTTRTHTHAHNTNNTPRTRTPIPLPLKTTPPGPPALPQRRRTRGCKAHPRGSVSFRRRTSALHFRTALPAEVRQFRPSQDATIPAAHPAEAAQRIPAAPTAKAIQLFPTAPVLFPVALWPTCRSSSRLHRSSSRCYSASPLSKDMGDGRRAYLVTAGVPTW